MTGSISSSGRRSILLFCRFNCSSEFRFSKVSVGSTLMLKRRQRQLNKWSARKYLKLNFHRHSEVLCAQNTAAAFLSGRIYLFLFRSHLENERQKGNLTLARSARNVHYSDGWESHCSTLLCFNCVTMQQ